jgi:hypothetical protein
LYVGYLSFFPVVNMAMQRELSSFPLPPQHVHKLSKAGYVTVEDLKGVSPTQLSDGKKEMM